MTRFVLRTDGGARGNPGPAGAAFVLTSPEGDLIARSGRYLGETTNNVAEYEALLWGLRTAVERQATPLTVLSDSELMVRQLNGLYRVKNAGLKPLHEQASRLLARLGDVRVEHVRRAANTEADALANEAMDARGDVGDTTSAANADFGQGTLFR